MNLHFLIQTIRYDGCSPSSTANGADLAGAAVHERCHLEIGDEEFGEKADKTVPIPKLTSSAQNRLGGEDEGKRGQQLRFFPCTALK